ncbi:MAG: methyltransferase [Chitinophagaceae bacterium]|nr:methyltransferase [Chitinophagaceae bacterium]
MNSDPAYWDKLYTDKETRWDIGYVSTPLKEYFDQLRDKDISILIPGCGNSYEAECLLQQGFTNITLIDISPLLTKRLEEKFAAHLNKGLTIITGDFFKLKGQYDLIVEQTFFCAIDPSQRLQYADQVHALLKPGGKLSGVLFNRSFEGGPPFGGSTGEYRKLFEEKFSIKTLATCYNSIEPREGTEVFIIACRT